MCTAMKIQLVSFFEILETGLAQIYADLLEIRIDKKKSNEHGRLSKILSELSSN
jgi:hypothetical protein